MTEGAPEVPTGPDGWIDRGGLGFFWSYQLVVYFVVPLLAGLEFYYGVDFPGVSPLETGAIGTALLLVIGPLSERFLLPFAEPIRIRLSSEGVELQLHRLTVWRSRVQVPWSAFDGVPQPGRSGVVLGTFRNPVLHRRQTAIFSDRQYRAMLDHPAAPPAWKQFRLDLGSGDGAPGGAP